MADSREEVRGAKALTETIVGMLLAYPSLPEEVGSLPPHLESWVRSSYACELCDVVVIPPQTRGMDCRNESSDGEGESAWLAEPVDMTWAVEVQRPWGGVFSSGGIEVHGAKEVRMRGRVCRVCLKSLLGQQRRWRDHLHPP
jgi:hypothetical protein